MRKKVIYRGQFLNSSPPAEASLETLQQLQDLHPAPSTPVSSAIPQNAPRNTYIPSDKAIYSAIRNAPNKIRSGPTNWSYEMLKNAMTSDPSTDLSAFKEILIKFCTGGFRPDTIHLFRLAWMFAFLKNERGDKRPVAAGEVLRKVAGKAIAIDYRVPWKEAGGRHQYGLNTPDGVNMVILMVEDTICQNVSHGALAVDGQNAFNAARRQAILNQLYASFPQLAVFVETWYLDPSPLWYYMNDHSVAIIFSREGVQQGDVIATFLFSLVFQPVLERIYVRASALCNTIQVFAILDDITMTAPVHLLQQIYLICTEELGVINIATVPRKSHALINERDREAL